MDELGARIHGRGLRVQFDESRYNGGALLALVLVGKSAIVPGCTTTVWGRGLNDSDREGLAGRMLGLLDRAAP